MALQFDATVRNAMLDGIETAIGTAPTLRIRTGAAPANCAAADSGTVLAAMTLPSNWLADASSGSKALAGTWQDASADASGDAGHFRVYDSGGTCKIQGTVTATGGGGDMTIASVTLTATQQVNVTGFTLTAPGA